MEKAKPFILNYIGEGHENAVTRQQLSIVTGLDDRIVRMEIEKARKDYPILNLGDGKGYFLPTLGDKIMVRNWLGEMESRQNAIVRSMEGARKFLRKLGRW